MSVKFNNRSRVILYFLIALASYTGLVSCTSSPAGKDQQIVRAEYTVRGTVVSLNPSASSIELDHEEITGFMPAMTMPFRVKDPALLTGLKPGDHVTFVLAIDSGIELITKIEKTSGS